MMKGVEKATVVVCEKNEVIFVKDGVVYCNGWPIASEAVLVASNKARMKREVA